MPSIVYFSDLKNKNTVSPLSKVKKLINRCEPKELYKKGDLTALKVHFGELGNTAFIRPLYLRPALEVLKECGANPFLTDTNTLYSGMRNNSVNHIHNAILNGFNYAALQTPVIIADGLRGENYKEIPIPNGKLLKTAKIGTDILNADSMMVFSHFKGHELTGFGGAIKNLSMGCASRAGKLAMHSTSKPAVNTEKCTACGRCKTVCLWDAIVISGTARITEKCTGCARCVGICPEHAISAKYDSDVNDVQRMLAEYASAVVAAMPRPMIYVNFLTSMSPACDCFPGNDAPVLPDIGYMSSLDPVALDAACYDVVMHAAGGIDPFAAKGHGVKGNVQLEHAEKIGFGSREYELKKI